MTHSLKDIAQYAYNHYLKNEYTDKSNTAGWVYPTAQDIKRDPTLANKPTVFRPNHGLPHSLKVMTYVRPIIEYLKKFGTNAAGFQFSENEINKLEICALFSVTGRENDTGWAGNPEQYMNFRQKSGENFEKYCRENKIFIVGQEI